MVDVVSILNDRDMLSTKEVAQIAGISVQLAQKLIREKKIPGRKLGREIRVARKDLEQYLGITKSSEDIKKELYITQLENENKHLKFVLKSVKNNLNNISFVLGEG